MLNRVDLLPLTLSTQKGAHRRCADSARLPSTMCFKAYAVGGFGAPGAPGAEGPPGWLGAAAAGASPSGGKGSLQNGHTTGRKLGDTIFLPQEGQINGPEVVSGGLKHMAFPFLPRWTHTPGVSS